MLYLLRSRENIFFYCFALLSGISFILGGDWSSDMITQLLFNHITTYLSQFSFIIICAVKLARNLHISKHLIVRVGDTQFIIYQYLTTLIMGGTYIIAQYLLAFFISSPAGAQQVPFIVLGLGLNALLVFLFVFILNISNWGGKQVILVTVSIVLSVLFHYGYCAIYLAKLYYS